MGSFLNRLGTIIVTAVLVSAFWIFLYNIQAGADSDGEVITAGDKKIVDPKGVPPVAVAEGVTVGPAGLAIPVAGIKPDQLIDTFTQARAGGARVHDAIDIMAPHGTPVVAAAPGTVEKCSSARAAAGSPPTSARPTSAGAIIMPICSAMRRA
jgi:peptidoglycan LD-endopeptidase LytH